MTRFECTQTILCIRDDAYYYKYIPTSTKYSGKEFILFNYDLHKQPLPKKWNKLNNEDKCQLS